MRAMGLSLTGLLVAFGIYMLLSSMYTVPMLQRGNTARQQAQQLSGHGAGGMSHMASITLAPSYAGGGSRLNGLVVQSIVAGGPMDAFFGLTPGDEITEIENVGRARDFQDDELFKALVLEAYSRSQVIVVNRPGVAAPIRLPDDKNSIAAVPPGGTPGNAPPPALTPATPQTPPDPVDESTPLERAIRNFARP